MIDYILRFKAIIYVLFILSGCATVITSDTVFYTDKVPSKVDTNSIMSSSWFSNETNQVSEISFKHADGIVTRGIHFSVRDSKYVVVYFGGNGFRVNDAAVGLSKQFNRIGVDFVWVDYRGVGSSDGIPTLKNVRDDAVYFIEYYVSKFDKPIILHGVSMGSVVVSDIVDKLKINVAAIVLESPIFDVDDLFNRMSLPWQSIKVEEDLKHQNCKRFVGENQKPILFISANDDKFTPSLITRKFYQQSPSKNKIFLSIENASHVNSMTFDNTVEGYANFISNLTVNKK